MRDREEGDNGLNKSLEGNGCVRRPGLEAEGVMLCVAAAIGDGDFLLRDVVTYKTHEERGTCLLCRLSTWLHVLIVFPWRKRTKK